MEIMKPTILTFEQALDRSNTDSPHLLLGNGFSIACRSDIFTYDALFDNADFEDLSTHAREAFDALGTTDFEAVMQALERASALIELYEPASQSLADEMRADSEALREVLINAIADSHPDHPNQISDNSYASCKHFLSHFDRIYTLNYDLLLYWTLMQSEIAPPLNFDDGFRTPDEGERDYVTWEPENTYNQDLYYLHGALHIFDDRTEIQKFTWINTKTRLTEQIRSALRNEMYPLFVAEGNQSQKFDNIRHSDFLSKAYRSFLNIRNTLFIYGHSLHPSDEHFLRCIEKGYLDQLFISIYGDPLEEDNQRVINRARQLSRNREEEKEEHPLDVRFFDAESASVWN